MVALLVACLVGWLLAWLVGWLANNGRQETMSWLKFRK